MYEAIKVSIKESMAFFDQKNLPRLLVSFEDYSNHKQHIGNEAINMKEKIARESGDRKKLILP